MGIGQAIAHALAEVGQAYTDLSIKGKTLENAHFQIHTDSPTPAGQA